MCYSVFQCVAVYHSVLQCLEVRRHHYCNIHDYNIVQPVPHIVMSHVTHRYMTHCLCV